jgi:hypothetical protein
MDQNQPKRIQSFSMSDRDQRNLNFLLTVDHKTLLEWYETASMDDLLYAQELFQAKTSELICQELELLDCVYDIRYVKMANEVIDKAKCPPVQ